MRLDPNKIKKSVHIQGYDFHLIEQIYVVEDENINKSKLFNTLVPINNYKPAKGDKIYIYPGCTIPRFKIKEFCKKYSVAIVKDINSSNIQVMSEKSYEELVCNHHGYTYKKDDLVAFLKKYKPTRVDMISAIENSEHEYVFLAYNSRNTIDNLDTNEEIQAEDYKEDSDDYNKYSLWITGQDSYAKIMNMISSTTLVNESDIQLLINDNTTIDDDQFKSMVAMLESNDMSNVKVAMEVMANCDYKKNCVPLLLLIKEYGGKMYNSPTRNHVNFKSLLKFFEIDSLGRFHLNDIITALIKKKFLNQTNLNRLMPLVKEELDSYSSISEHFKVNTVQYSDEVVECLENNIIDDSLDTEIVESEPLNLETRKNDD